MVAATALTEFDCGRYLVNDWHGTAIPPFHAGAYWPEQSPLDFAYLANAPIGSHAGRFMAGSERACWYSAGSIDLGTATS